MQQSLAFLHEIAHHLAWVRSGRKVDLKTDKALYLHDAQDDNEKLDKKYRKLIYLSEKNDAAYHEQIHNELNLKLPIWRVKAERDLDIWIYFRFYQSGKYPKRKQRTQKRKELIKKYKEM